jgi:hypothetical protein
MVGGKENSALLFLIGVTTTGNIYRKDWELRKEQDKGTLRTKQGKTKERGWLLRRNPNREREVASVGNIDPK